MDSILEFESFPKITRLKRKCVVTEKLDGTNAQIHIGPNGEFLVGSRNRYIIPGDDNFGFAKWAHEHEEELLLLGEGRHYGEWWGQGVGRRYGMEEKVFSLFNVQRWGDHNPNTPACCKVVPILYQGLFESSFIEGAMTLLGSGGSIAAPGFMKPEGIVVFHSASRLLTKQTFEHDEQGKPE